MTSEPMRDPRVDHLLTPQNSALVVIDYQPSQIRAVTAMDQALLVRNIVSVARTAKTYRLPIVLSTVNVANGSGPTIPALKEVLADSSEIDRTQLNAWEDIEFRQAVEATGRKKLIMTVQWTEVGGRRRARRPAHDIWTMVDIAPNQDGHTPARGGRP